MPETYTFIDYYGNYTAIALEHWRLASVDGLGMPDVGHLGSRYAQQDGETYLGTRLKKRIVTFSFQLVHDTESDLWDARDELLRIMQNFAHGFHLLISLPNGDTRQIDLRFDSGLTLPRDLSENLTQQVCVMQCVAHQPLIYDPDPEVLDFGEAEIVQTPVIIDNVGSWAAYPIITVTGPLNEPYLENYDTDEVLDFSSFDIAGGDIVTIDLTPGHKTITSANAGNILPYLTADSDLATWHLDPLDNSIQFWGYGATYDTLIEFSFNALYIGI
jgi:hypothetical protein